MADARRLFLATRPQFFPAVAVPVALGAAVAWHEEGSFDPLVFALTLAAAVCLHGGMNALNDYFDFRNGADALNRTPLRPFSGGSRLIQDGLVAPGQMRALGATLVAAGSLAGVYLAWAATPLLLVVGAAGLLLGYFYSAPPVSLASRGLGEAAAGLSFGLLMVVGSCMAQTSAPSLAAAVASLPVSFLIAGLLFINEFPDHEPDRDAGKRNLVVRLGPSRARYGLAAIVAAAFASLIAGAASGVLPALSLAALAGVPPALMAATGLVRNYDKGPSLVPSIKSVILAHTATGLAMTAAFALA